MVIYLLQKEEKIHMEIRMKIQCKNAYGIEIKVASKVLKVHRRGRCYDIANCNYMPSNNLNCISST